MPRPKADSPLGEKYLDALVEDELIIELVTMMQLTGGTLKSMPALRLKRPPVPPGRKQIDLLGMPMVANEGETTHAQMLRRLADDMDEVRR